MVRIFQHILICHLIDNETNINFTTEFYDNILPKKIDSLEITLFGHFPFHHSSIYSLDYLAWPVTLKLSE